MCENTDPPFQILTECNEGYIGVCRCCGEYNFVYKNMLLTFQEPELHHFFEWFLETMHKQEYNVTLHNGKTQFFNGPVPNLFFVYTKAELAEITGMYTEVQLLLDARRILCAPNKN
jgi:hypothetical protein